MQAIDGGAIETPRLILDRLRADDAAALYAYRADPAVARYQGWIPADEAEAAAFIAAQAQQPFDAPGWQQRAIRRRDDGELLGDCGLRLPESTDEEAEFGVSLKPVQQRRGYAREAAAALIEQAFRTYGCRRIVASVDPRNAASLALCRSLGMRQEAHHRERFYLRGEWVDDVIFALLVREWPALKDAARAESALRFDEPAVRR
jgi:RimJ/RimL family protein N-acetyltransferase